MEALNTEQSRVGSGEGDSAPLSPVRLTVIVAALMASLLLEALDQTVVGTALPRIIATIHGLDRYTWAVTAYLLASTTVLPLSGKLSDQFGRKRFLLAGVSLFLLGSALCGTATSIDALILFRALQGLGAGIGISLVFTLVADLFPPERRARWQGVVGGVYALSSVAGPTLGGWLADHGPPVAPFITAGTRWRWVFLVNLPLGLIALLVLAVALPAGIGAAGRGGSGRASLRQIDLPGAILSVAASSSLLIGLTRAGEPHALSHPAGIVTPIALAAALFAAFAMAERFASEPILPAALFRNRVFTADAVLTIFLFMTLFGAAFYVPLFLQRGMSMTPTTAGLTMTPFSVSIVLGNALATLAIDRTHRYRHVVIAGTVLMTCGIALLTQITVTSSAALVGGEVALAGLGMGLLFTSTSVAVLHAVPPPQLGVGYGIVRFLGQVGGSLGVASVGTVVNVSLAAGLPLDVAIRRGLDLALLFSLAAVAAGLTLRDVRRTTIPG